MVIPVPELVEGTFLDVVSTSSTTGVMMVVPVPEPVEGTRSVHKLTTVFLIFLSDNLRFLPTFS